MGEPSSCALSREEGTMERKVTMESIAGELGVSKSAVSKALNGKADISKELRDTILRKAKELHYTVRLPFTISLC